MQSDRSRGPIDTWLHARLGHFPRVFKLVKYSAASVAGVLTGQSTLLFFLLVLDFDPVPSNIISVTLGAIPNYLINRAWTFDKQGSHSLTREVIPFWSMAFLGLVISTFAVAWAANRWDDNAIAILLANTGSFGVLWVAKFFVLDRVLFAPIAAAVEHETTESPEEPPVTVV